MKMTFVGDIWLRPPEDASSYGDGIDPLERVKDRLASPDILCGNLECFLDSGERCHKDHWKPGKVLIGDPSQISCLKKGGFDVVSIGNNHIMDGGVPGLVSTMETLTAGGISWCGAGRNSEEAEAPAILERRGKRVAFISATDYPEDYATSTDPGVSSVEPFLSLIKHVREAASRYDVVVVLLHCDLEFSAAPAPYRVKLSRRLIDHGAALVIQHHPHVIQGVEEYGKGLIAYSLGNFIFKLKDNSYQKNVPEVRYGAILSVDVADRGEVTSWSLEPVWIGDDDYPVPLHGQQLFRAQHEFERRCSMLKSHELIIREWRQRVWREGRYHALMVYYRLRGRKFGKAFRYMIDIVFDKRNRRWIASFFTFGYL